MMELYEVRNVMKNEKQCVQRASSNLCNRDCLECDLVMNDTNLLEAYDEVLKVLNRAIYWELSLDKHKELLRNISNQNVELSEEKLENMSEYTGVNILDFL